MTEDTEDEPKAEESLEEIIHRVLDARIQRRLQLTSRIAVSLVILVVLTAGFAGCSRLFYLAGQRDISSSSEYRNGRNVMRQLANWTPNQVYCIWNSADYGPNVFWTIKNNECSAMGGTYTNMLYNNAYVSFVPTHSEARK